MTTPETIRQLVERFEEHRETYRAGKYNETQLRREFLDPFFEALGWDVFNKQGYAEMYKDVVHEDSLEIEGENKAPDYAFRVGGQRKFFVEAKKPAVRIETDIHPAFQLRRYAWSAKLPLSILTDFEEFAVYDCRAKPDKKDKASMGRVKLYSYRDYIGKWEEIAAVLSREAVLKGSFDAFAEGTRLKKGTAEVDDAFLAEIERWRELLAKNIAPQNPSLNVRELNYAVQMTIDRIVFLRICEDRGVERDEQLKEIGSGKGVYEALGQLFQRADARYNSGLFHFKDEKDASSPADTLTLRLKIDDKPLQDILKNLYYPESPYVFREIPSDILGQVYERFLGKVIRLTPARQAKVEEKPEVRKAGGVYYTPTYIVKYIVENTVGKLLDPTPGPSPDGRAPSGEGRMTPKQAAGLRILDPACGSGTFPLGAYQYLLDWHLKWYTERDPETWAGGKKPAIFQSKDGYRLTTSKKKEILLNNIYGVDIDPQAVEVTKLSLLLKVLEGESHETIGSQLALFQERVLPDLGRNIKCGNSLIGPDYFEGRQLTMLVDEEERYRVNAFDWKAEFPQVFDPHRPSDTSPKSDNKNLDKKEKVSMSDWGEVGRGFDAVIGNPPYGAYLYETEKNYLLSNYVCQSYQLDTYLLFLEKSIKNLLKQKGYYGMIIPNPWITNLLQTATRKFVVENTEVVEIVQFKYPVFKKVTVDTQVVILQKDKPTQWKPIATIVENQSDFLLNKNLLRIFHQQDKWLLLDGGVINIFMNPNQLALAEKIKKSCIELEQLFDITVGIKPYQAGKGKPPQTKKTVEERPFDSITKLDSTFRAYLRGSDINRYEINPLKSRFIKYGPWLAEPRPAANFGAPEKIFMRQTGDSIIATLDIEKYLCLNNMHVIVPKTLECSIKYVLGILNSKLVNWYYHSLNPEIGEALAEVKKTNVAKLPVYPINFSDPADKARHDKMVALVERMLALTPLLSPQVGGRGRAPQEQEMVKREIESTDGAIDRLVYELYGLTEEEIRIVEGRE